MASPLVGTKLYVPRLRSNTVVRERLAAGLERGSQGKLTVVSAPPGFGKTTAIAAWLARRDADRADRTAVAWVSLDENDSQPASFWTYVVTALQSVAPQVGSSLLMALESGKPPTDGALATLLNDLDELTELAALTRLDEPAHPEAVARGSQRSLHLVLDDYHLADSPEVAAGVAFFLEHLPEHVHLVISTRADPGLSLARLRAQGDLVELRAADLRFTVEEVDDYLTQSAGLTMPPGTVAALEGRTEGWIAALQLAAISMRGRADIAAFVAGFAGDDRYVVDYLVQEVLARQPSHVRSFLLQTSILDRLCAELCDAVTGRHDGKATLAVLERANLFLVPLDDQRRWFRYHHLFAEVLRIHLGDDQPDQVADLHRRASGWYDEAGEPVAAVRHAREAGDDQRAATLIELAIPTLRRDRQEATIRGWVDVVSDDVVANRPVLALGLIGGLMASNDFDPVPARLRDLERWVPVAAGAAPPPRDMVAVDVDELRRLPGCVELYRAALALQDGDASATLQHARQAIALSDPHDPLTTASAQAVAALAHWSVGDLPAALEGYLACSEGLERLGHVADVLGCSITVADLQLSQGRIGDAAATYERGLRLGEQHGPPITGGRGRPLRGTADMHVGLAQVCLERGDEAAAVRQLELALELGDQFGLPQFPYRWRAVMASLRQGQGALAEAQQLLEEAQRLYVGDFLPNVRPLPAQRARVLVARGSLREADSWAEARALSSTDELSYPSEYEHLTLARLLLGSYLQERSELSLAQAEALLLRLLAAAEEGSRQASVIEVLVLLAVAQHAQGDLTSARGTLNRALALAEPEGHVRIFAVEGQPVAELLRTVASGVGPDYVRRLVAACERPTYSGDGAPPPHHAATSGASPQPIVIDSLSARELEVMRLLDGDLSGPDIARHLVVSLHTVRTHTKNIYTKLGVNSRRAAVRRAHELGLLTNGRIQRS